MRAEKNQVNKQAFSKNYSTKFLQFSCAEIWGFTLVMLSVKASSW